jgi:Zn-dependent peptidase ImmA (M78 family)
MIDGERVRQARELHRWTQAQLVAEVPDLTQSRLSRIEKGQSLLAADDISAAAIAAVTGVTIDWLRRPTSVSLHGLSPHFRARSRTTESAKSAGVAWANLVNETHLRLADQVRELPVRLERFVGADPRIAAHQTRRILGFDAFEPLPYLLLALERAGVRLLGLPPFDSTVDAFCGWSGSTPLIAITGGAPGDRLRWTVAHEVGHLVLHEVGEQGRETEAQADAFAAELLTPLDALRFDLPPHPTLRTLTMLKSRWGVSVKSLVRRCKELGVIDNERAIGLYRQISARGWNRAEPGYVPREKPRALTKMLEIAYGRSSAEVLAREMGWSFELADLILQEHARRDELPVVEVIPYSTDADHTVVAMPRRARF